MFLVEPLTLSETVGFGTNMGFSSTLNGRTGTCAGAEAGAMLERPESARFVLQYGPGELPGGEGVQGEVWLHWRGATVDCRRVCPVRCIILLLGRGIKI
jgi:hypothetical protein